MDRYKQTPHTADLAAEIYGKDLRELFANAAYAMFDIMADPIPDGGSVKARVTVAALDAEGLLIAWLNELLFMSFARKTIFQEFRLSSFDGKALEAEVSGACYAGKETLLKKEIKAATYHDLSIVKTALGYKVRVVFDV